MSEEPHMLVDVVDNILVATFNQTASLSGSDGAIHFAATLDHVHAGATPVTPGTTSTVPTWVPPTSRRTG